MCMRRTCARDIIVKVDGKERILRRMCVCISVCMCVCVFVVKMPSHTQKREEHILHVSFDICGRWRVENKPGLNIRRERKRQF